MNPNSSRRRHCFLSGIGEIGLAGFAAAVTAAVHHATGIRVRELPIKIEDLLR